MRASTYERVRHRPRNLMILLVTVLCGLLVCLLDQRLYHTLRVDDWDEKWRMKDWVIALRSAGYVPLWIVFGLMVDGMVAWRGSGYGIVSGKGSLVGRAVGGASLPWVPTFPGLLIVLGAAGGGLWAEVLKVVIRRHRPSVVNDGTYVFDWFSDPVMHRGLGLASSHAGVAFGAAFIIARLSPRAGIVAILVAMGCSMTRLLSGAHFASDVYVAMVIAWLWALAIWRLWERNRRVTVLDT